MSMILFYYMSLTMENLWEKMDYTYMEHHIMLHQLSKTHVPLITWMSPGFVSSKKIDLNLVCQTCSKQNSKS